MRVTHVITRLVVGGAQENTLTSLLGLRQVPAVEVALISGPTVGSEGSLEPAVRRAGIPFELVPELVRPVHPLKDLIALHKLTRILRRQRPDIVHTHSGKAGVLGRLAAHRAGVPVILHHIHGPSFGPFQGALANGIFRLAERHAARVTTHFACSAEAMTRRYLAAGIGHPGQFTRIFSGFNLEPFLQSRSDSGLRAELGLPPDAFVIGKLARLAPLKGHDDLLEALRRLLPDCPQARLLIVGGGARRPQIETQAAQMGLRSQIVFAGLVPPEAVAKYVGVMDCLAHLSRREALSRALPQALAAGKPVVAYDFDGADEVCLDGQTGFLIRTGAVEEAAARLLQLANDPQLRHTLGQRGQEYVRVQFSAETLVERLVRLYRQLLEAQGRTSG
jgi:glycosyltransferase involved in cell wall biosynthesis